MRKQISTLRDRLEACGSRRVMLVPTATIDNRRMELDRVREQLVTAQEKKLSLSRQRFIALTSALEAMSPLRVLTRGYAIASDRKEQCIRSVSQLEVGESIRLRLLDGSAACRVEHIEGVNNDCKETDIEF